MNEEQIKKIIEKSLPTLRTQKRGEKLKYEIIKNRILDVETPFKFMEHTGPTEITYNVSPRTFPNLLIKVFVEIPQTVTLPDFLIDDLTHIFLEFENKLNIQMLYEFGDKRAIQEHIELKRKQTQKKKEGKRLHLYDKLDLLEAEENIKKSISSDAVEEIKMNPKILKIKNEIDQLAATHHKLIEDYKQEKKLNPYSTGSEENRMAKTISDSSVFTLKKISDLVDEIIKDERKLSDKLEHSDINKDSEQEFIKQKSGYGILDNTPENENKLRDSGWGHEKIEISFEDWVAVMQGKALGIHDGEYTHFITVDKTAPVDASFWEKMFLNKSKEFDNLYNEVSKFLKNSKSS